MWSSRERERLKESTAENRLILDCQEDSVLAQVRTSEENTKVYTIGEIDFIERVQTNQ